MLEGEDLALRTACVRGLESSRTEGRHVTGLITVRQSQIPSGGLGAFAEVFIPRGQPLVAGAGEIMRLSVADAVPEVVHAFSMADADFGDLCFGCEPPFTNVVRYFNSAHGTSLAANVEVLWHEAVPIVHTILDVHEGEEMLLSYPV